MPDRQANAVYRWENSFADWVSGHAPIPLLRRIVRRAERLYRVPPATLVFPKRQKGATGRWLPSLCEPAPPFGHGRIFLRPRHRTVAVALHETAHWIDNWLFGHLDGAEDHGPRWLGIYLHLLEHFRVAPRAALHASARAAGLEWTHASWVGHRAVRRRYKRAVRIAAAERIAALA